MRRYMLRLGRQRDELVWRDYRLPAQLHPLKVLAEDHRLNLGTAGNSDPRG
jgi:hypothetical protein